MTDEMNVRVFRFDPTVPHDLMDEIIVLGDAHGVHFSAASIILNAARVGVGVGENDVHSAAVHARAGAGALGEIVEPANDVFDGVRILVAIVGIGGAGAVDR